MYQYIVFLVRFNGDYMRFRKADKAWNERERTRRKTAIGARQLPSRALAARAGASLSLQLRPLGIQSRAAVRRL